MLPQTIDVMQLAKALGPELNKDIPIAQAARAIKRFEMSFLPGWRMITHTFSAVSSKSGIVSVQIDGGYGYFFTHITATQATADVNSLLVSIQVNSGNNYVPDTIPFQILTALTRPPLEMSFYCKANSALQAEFQNGTGAAANVFNLIFFGYKLPFNKIQELRKDLGLQPE